MNTEEVVNCIFNYCLMSCIIMILPELRSIHRFFHSILQKLSQENIYKNVNI